MPYKAVIFDLDGTLLDSLHDLAHSGNRVLTEMEMPEHPLDAYRIFVGDGMQTLITRILPEDKRNPAIIEKAVDLFRKDYANNWKVHTAMYDGIEAMLTHIEDNDFPKSILSNKPEEFTRLCVEELLPAWKFWSILGQRSDVPKKPDPARAFEIAEKLGLDPVTILFVGDTAVDMQTAANAGMDGVGVLWGFRTAEELQAHGAQFLIDHPGELLEILGM